MNKKLVFSGLLAVVAIMAFAFAPKISSCSSNENAENKTVNVAASSTEEGIKFVEAKYYKKIKTLIRKFFF